ncbi:Thioesterase superfamily [Corchorus olitorius]|uniref:Thioesterase superfamily n=1 Tax=Corchorus olitorius TaxID=93759 RepID=A0A1R3H8M6_9ROSI|nr:Thioesterase superfamily [Corchorus olitorius]
MEEEKNFVERSRKYLEDVSAGAIGYEIESRTLRGLRAVRFEPGFVRCQFTVPTTLIDNIGGATTYTISDRLKVTLNFNISYYSTAKIQDEVEIEGKVIANKGKITSVAVEIKRKDNGELIAIGKSWMASNDYRSPLPKL